MSGTPDRNWSGPERGTDSLSGFFGPDFFGRVRDTDFRSGPGILVQAKLIGIM